MDGDIASTSGPFRWVAKCNPMQKEIALKEDTYNIHMLGEDRTETEKINIEKTVDLARKTVEKPRFIYYDKNNKERGRIRLINLVNHPDFSHLQAMVVVVDTDREPHEVVTYTIKRNLNQEDTSGGILYDADND